ncbi:unnamed protein product, partial [Rotaria sp. Silwood1]
MSLPLISPVSSNTNDELAELITLFSQILGFCPNSILTMQHRPVIVIAFMQLNKAVMTNHGRVTTDLKFLIAERYGATSEKLAYISEYSTYSTFNDAERAALDFVVVGSTVPNAVNSSIIEYLHKYWNDGEIVEILD